MTSLGAGSKCYRIVTFKVTLGQRNIKAHLVPLLIQQGSPALLQPPRLTPSCPPRTPPSSPAPHGQAHVASGQLSLVLLDVVPKLA